MYDMQQDSIGKSKYILYIFYHTEHLGLVSCSACAGLRLLHAGYVTGLVLRQTVLLGLSWNIPRFREISHLQNSRKLLP